MRRAAKLKTLSIQAKNALHYAHSKTTHGHEAHSEGQVEQAVSLMTAQDVAELDDEEIIILHRNRKPIRAKRMDFRNFPELARLTTTPPSALPTSVIQIPFRISRLIRHSPTSSAPKVCQGLLPRQTGTKIGQTFPRLHPSLPPPWSCFRVVRSCRRQVAGSPVRQISGHP